MRFEVRSSYFEDTYNSKNFDQVDAQLSITYTFQQYI